MVKRIAETLNTKISIKSVEDTPGSPKRRCPDISKIIHLTGYQPQTKLKEGLKKSYEWYETRLNQKYE